MTERDPALERAWREHSRETPPPELDRAILAAAHRAVGSRPQQAEAAEATSPQRWWMPLAAAAAIGTVVVGILQTMPADTDLVLPAPPPGKLAATAPASPAASRNEAVRPQPAPAAQSPASTAATGAPADADGARAPVEKKQEVPSRSAMPRKEAAPAPLPAPRQAPSPMATPAPGSAPSAPAPPAPDAFPATAPAAKARSALAATAPAGSEDAAPRANEADAPRDTFAGRGQAAAAGQRRLAQAPAGPPSASVRARDDMRDAAPKPLAKTAVSLESQAKARDPDAWIARIRKLRDEGNTADAIRELREFRDVVPDAERRLPADLREWAASVRN